jgi:hypothetical protein
MHPARSWWLMLCIASPRVFALIDELLKISKLAVFDVRLLYSKMMESNAEAAKKDIREKNVKRFFILDKDNIKYAQFYLLIAFNKATKQ